MADPIRQPVANKPPTGAPNEPAPQPPKPNPDEKLVKENDEMRKQLDELRERERRINHAIRKLSAAILTPGGVTDKGQGRRNGISSAVQELVKEFEFRDET